MSTQKKIFIVEDDQDILLLYKDRLTTAGLAVENTALGYEVLPLLKQYMPNLILLDVMIQGKLNGMDVLTQIKKDPNLKKIPVIVLTNLNAEEKTAKDLGAAEYLIKADHTTDQVIDIMKKHL